MPRENRCFINVLYYLYTRQSSIVGCPDNPKSHFNSYNKVYASEILRKTKHKYNNYSTSPSSCQSDQASRRHITCASNLQRHPIVTDRDTKLNIIFHRSMMFSPRECVATELDNRENFDNRTIDKINYKLAKS